MFCVFGFSLVLTPNNKELGSYAPRGLCRGMEALHANISILLLCTPRALYLGQIMCLTPSLEFKFWSWLPQRVFLSICVFVLFVVFWSKRIFPKAFGRRFSVLVPDSWWISQKIGKMDVGSFKFASGDEVEGTCVPESGPICIKTERPSGHALSAWDNTEREGERRPKSQTFFLSTLPLVFLYGEKEGRDRPPAFSTRFQKGARTGWGWRWGRRRKEKKVAFSLESNMALIGPLFLLLPSYDDESRCVETRKKTLWAVI